jgi:hypothetical protein
MGAGEVSCATCATVVWAREMEDARTPHAASAVPWSYGRGLVVDRSGGRGGYGVGGCVWDVVGGGCWIGIGDALRCDVM